MRTTQENKVVDMKRQTGNNILNLPLNHSNNDAKKIFLKFNNAESITRNLYLISCMQLYFEIQNSKRLPPHSK